MAKPIMWVCTALLLAGLSSCAGARVVKAYAGSDRDIATLFTPKNLEYTAERGHALLVAVDGKSLYSEWDGYPDVTKILPGNYLIKVQCRLSPHVPGDIRLLKVKLEAGHYYELACAFGSSSSIDHGSDDGSVKKLLPSSGRASP